MQVRNLSMWTQSGGVIWRRFTLVTLTFLGLAAGNKIQTSRFFLGLLTIKITGFECSNINEYISIWQATNGNSAVCHCSVVLGVHSWVLVWMLWEFEVVISFFLNKRVKYDFPHHRNVPLWNVLEVEVVLGCWGLFSLRHHPPQGVEWSCVHLSSQLGL